ncbi:hypothetical protein [Vibrio metoecus]|uniref:F4 family fimbrial subunit n=1 Tax=Vibrio metoecus TaxID=1481663 RepID=UPI0001B99B07|nr:hypothetical protein [Vibrio metoecus]EEX66688.1 fimbrial protein [Vibrio metoecus]
MMKKTLLAAATASALVVSGGALAAFADAPKDEGAGASAQLKITGTLTNTNPNWMWKIPAESQAAVSDVALNKIAGVVNGANTEFAITKNPLLIIEGYMKTPSPKAGSGLTPVISVGDKNMAKDCGTSAGCVVSVTASDARSNVGSVEVSLTVGAASAYHEVGGVAKIRKGGLSTADAVSVLTSNQADFENSYKYPSDAPGGTMLSEYDAWLGTSNLSKVSDSRIVRMKSSKLVVPSNAVPATWAATLPITISLK